MGAIFEIAVFASSAALTFFLGLNSIKDGKRDINELNKRVDQKLHQMANKRHSR